jgi:hypothetical protein
MHSLNRQGPLSEWMNSECRHPEQRLARLGARLAFVMGAYRRLGALPRHRPIGAASFLAERPIRLSHWSPMTGYARRHVPRRRDREGIHH